MRSWELVTEPTGPVTTQEDMRQVTPAKTPETQEKHAIATLRRVISYDTKRTEALKAFGKDVCTLRRLYQDPAGASAEYKSAMERIYASVDIPADSASSIQASIRYHIGNALREEFTAEELQAVGLSEKTPLERARDARTGGDKPAKPEAQEEAEVPEGPTPAPRTMKAQREAVKAGTPAVLQEANPPAPKHVKGERRDYDAKARQEIVLPPDPLVIFGHALDSVRATASLPEIPATQAASMRDMIRRMRVELNRLEARVAEKAKAPARKASTRARKAA